MHPNVYLQIVHHLYLYRSIPQSIPIQMYAWCALPVFTTQLTCTYQCLSHTCVYKSTFAHTHCIQLLFRVLVGVLEF